MLAAVLLAAAIALVGTAILRTNFRTRSAALAAKTSRRRMLFVWAGSIYVTYALSSQLALLALHRELALLELPDEFAPVARAVGYTGDSSTTPILMVAVALALGVVLSAVLLRRRARRGQTLPAVEQRSIGAAQRRGEIVPALLLALSAGYSEELFFRLLIPLLFAIVFGAPGIGFVVSLALFVAVHRHQGRRGMAIVAAIGVALTWLYLLSGLLWGVMALHVALDVNAVVLRPLFAGRLRAVDLDAPETP